MKTNQLTLTLIAASAIFCGFPESSLASPYSYYYEYAEEVEAALNPSDPSVGAQHSATGIRRNVGAKGAGGVSAGDKYVAPEAVDPEGSKNAIYAEYNYIDIGTDRAGVGIAGSANVYSVGYEHVLSDNLFLDFSYEFSDESLRPAAVRTIDSETNTVAGAISSVLLNNIYGMLIVGGSWSDGATSLGGVQLAGGDGNIFFVNPGLGTTWVFGNLIVDASASYLYQDSEINTVAGVAPFVANNEMGQVILETGARYNISDTLYARVGLQYNNIVDEDFAAAVPLDKNWLQINSEIGVELTNGVDVFVGHAYDASHNIFDTHTARAGISYSF